MNIWFENCEVHLKEVSTHNSGAGESESTIQVQVDGSIVKQSTKFMV